MGGPAHVGIQERKRNALRAERHACSPGLHARARMLRSVPGMHKRRTQQRWSCPFRVHSVCDIGRTDSGVEATGGKGY